MATKSTSKKAPAKKSTSRAKSAASTRAVSRRNDCTVKECIEDHPVLKFHATILTVLSIIVCLLVAILIISLTK